MAINEKAYKFSTRDDTTFMVSSGGGEEDNGIFIINEGKGYISEYETSLDKTWQEIYDATSAHKLCVIFAFNDEPDQFGSVHIVSNVDHDNNNYYTYRVGTTDDGEVTYVALSNDVFLQPFIG